jgi:hypothetical protein
MVLSVSFDAAAFTTIFSAKGRIRPFVAVVENTGFSHFPPSGTSIIGGTPISIMMASDESGADTNNNDEYQYQLPPDAGPIATTCNLTEEQIVDLLSMRSEYKRDRNFAQADRILEELVAEGVYLHDNRKEWRADGYNHFGRTNEKTRAYVRRGGNQELPEEKLAEIAGVVEQRAEAKRKRDFRTSNALSETLTTEYGVHINDKEREWSLIFVSPDGEDEEEGTSSLYVPSPIVPLDDPTHTMDEETKTMIQQRLKDRLVARRTKDYAKADFIRDKLQKDYLVEIDDRTREWTIATGHDDDDEQGSPANEEIVIIAEIDAADVAGETIPTASNEHETESNLKTLTVAHLKEKLRSAGLPVSGNKADLVERLLETSKYI